VRVSTDGIDEATDNMPPPSQHAVNRVLLRRTEGFRDLVSGVLRHC
jgi:hypothetical protein